jgi:hypothetical protein
VPALPKIAAGLVAAACLWACAQDFCHDMDDMSADTRRQQTACRMM